MFNNLLRQINAYTDRTFRPSKNSPMIEQYEKCEKAIDHQVGKMKNILKQDLTLYNIEQKFDPTIKKNCNSWFSRIESLMWYEDGYNCDKTHIRDYDKEIREYIKEHGYLDKYNLDAVEWPKVQIMLYPNDVETIRINSSDMFVQKIIRNPIYRNIDYHGGKFYMEITNNDIEPIVKMYRYKEIFSFVDK